MNLYRLSSTNAKTKPVKQTKKESKAFPKMFFSSKLTKGVDFQKFF